MNQTKGGLETGDVVVYQGALLSKEEAEARGIRADTNHTISSLIERFRASGECRIKPAHLISNWRWS